jgi:hypothetical protein
MLGGNGPVIWSGRSDSKSDLISLVEPKPAPREIVKGSTLLFFKNNIMKKN